MESTWERLVREGKQRDKDAALEKAMLRAFRISERETSRRHDMVSANVNGMNLFEYDRYKQRQRDAVRAMFHVER